MRQYATAPLLSDIEWLDASWTVQKCLQQAERAPDVWMKDHMRSLADKWLAMASSLALEEERIGQGRSYTGRSVVEPPDPSELSSFSLHGRA